MKRLLWAATCAAALLAAPFASAQTYPSRPITLIVPLGTGGSTDVIGRLVAEGMRQHLGQPIVVENVTGAGGTIGVGRAAKATPDGYTLLIGQWGTNVASGAIYPLNFDLEKDLEPVGLIATQPFLIVARKTMEAKNLTELIAWMKANGDKVTQGNSGIGTPSHVGGILLQQAIGTKATMVPFRGAGQSSQALLGGQIDIILEAPALSLSQYRAGNIKVYAVADTKRIATAPEIPTAAEAGLPGFQFTFWHAFWAPKGTPKEIVAKLNEALVKTLADPSIKQKLVDFSQEIFPAEQLTPEALRTYHKAEIEKWWPIIKAAGIKAE